jgi:hypothetical protein
MSEAKASKLKLGMAALGAGFCVLGIVLAVLAVVNRQERGSTSLTLYPERQEEIVAERRAREMQSRLNLREDQIPAFTSAIMEVREQVRIMRENSAGDIDRLQMRQAMIQELDVRVAPLLDDEQRARYEQSKEILVDRVEKLRGLRQLFFDRRQQ